MAGWHWLLASVVLLGAAGHITAQDDEECDATLDFVFILDRSGSICGNGKLLYEENGKKTCDNWKHMLDFMTAAVEDMEIGEDKVRVAMVIFGNKGRLMWDLEEYDNAEDVIEAITGLEYAEEKTNTSGGIWVAYDQVFVDDKGDRDNVANVALIITDGGSTTDNDKTIPFADDLKEDKKVTIFTVGIETEDISIDELRMMSSPPQLEGQNYFVSADFDELHKILDPVLESTCEVAFEPEEPAGNPDCDRLDLVFLLDRSGSICDNDPSEDTHEDSCNNWDFIRNFVSDFVEEFSIGEDLVRVGLATFSNEGHFRWDLLEYTDRNTLQDAIESLSYSKGKTNTVDGLRVVDDMIFTEEGGDRPTVSNVLIIITDGQSNVDEDQTVAQAEHIREHKDVIMFSIGVTELVSESELSGLSSEPQVENENYFMTADFAQLQGILDSIVAEACEAAEPEQVSGCEVDLVFVLDYSGSIGSKRYNYVREFVVDFILTKLDNGTRLGVVLFSDDKQLGFHLDAYINQHADAAAAVAAINYQRGRTNTGSAIKYMHKDMFKESNGDRADVPNRVIVITDGNSNTPDRVTVITESRIAKSKGIHMLVIGITGWMNEAELIDIASYPREINVIKVPDVTDLLEFSNIVADLICNVGRECTSNTCENGGECVDGIGMYWCLCLEGYVGKDCSKTCREPADVAFALDSSGSIGKVDFQKQVDFLADIIHDGVYIDHTRVAVEEFASDTEIHWDFDEHDSAFDMLNAFDFYPEGGSTDTAGALEEMSDELFDEGSSRTQIGIVLTDGRSNSPDDTWQKAMRLRQDGVTMIAVGVGNNVRDNELEGIASNGNVLKVADFDSLDDGFDDLVDLMCNNVDECDSESCKNGGDCIDEIGGYSCDCPSGYTGPRCERECDGELDLVFVFDASGSMRRRRFAATIDFAVNVTKKMQIGEDLTHIGAVVFSEDSEVVFGLDVTYDGQNVIQAMNTQLKYRRGKTNIAGALDTMMNDVFEDGGDRSGVPNKCIFLTSGRSNINDDETISAAEDAVDEGIHMISVAVGRNPHMDEVEALATDDNMDVFLAESYTDLEGMVDDVVARTCVEP